MGSLRSLYELYSDSEGGISPDGLGWASFRTAVGEHGLLSPMFSNMLESCRARVASQGKLVRFEDICTTAASLIPNPAVDQNLQDMQMDASAVHRYVRFVRTRFKAGTMERKKMEAGAEDLAQSFRGTLLHLLRLAAREAASLDEMEVCFWISAFFLFPTSRSPPLTPQFTTPFITV